MTTATRRRSLQQSGTQERKWKTIQFSTPFIATAITYSVLMLAFHVKADPEYTDSGNYAEAPFVKRVQEGPFGLSNMDLILFGSFIMLAFELLQVLVAGSGSE